MTADNGDTGPGDPMDLDVQQNPPLTHDQDTRPEDPMDLDDYSVEASVRVATPPSVPDSEAEAVESSHAAAPPSDPGGGTEVVWVQRQTHFEFFEAVIPRARLPWGLAK